MEKRWSWKKLFRLVGRFGGCEISGWFVFIQYLKKYWGEYVNDYKATKENKCFKRSIFIKFNRDEACLNFGFYLKRRNHALCTCSAWCLGGTKPSQQKKTFAGPVGELDCWTWVANLRTLIQSFSPRRLGTLRLGQKMGGAWVGFPWEKNRFLAIKKS